VINGDDVYNSGVPRGLIEADRDQDVVMVIDRKPRYDSDDMKVISKGDRIVKVGKEIDSEAANGESIGMIRFVGSGTIRLKENLDRLVRQPVGKQIFWLRAVQDLIDQGYVVNWHECPVDAWAEIDFHPDLHLIRDTVLEHYADLVKNWEQPK
jgi:choline kinase